MADPLRKEFEAAWQAFQTLSSLRLIDDTLESEWKRGRHEYLAFLVPIEDAEARTYAAEVVDRISGIPGVEPYPDSYWHITVKGVGFRLDKANRHEEVTEEDIPLLSEAASRVFAEQPPFEVRIGKVNAFAEVVILEVWDSVLVRELNHRLLEQVPGLVRYPFDGPVFLPHVSIARFSSGDGLPQLKETLATLRDEPPGPTFRISRIDFIRAHLSAAAPAFETIESYTLGAGR